MLFENLTYAFILHIVQKIRKMEANINHF